MKFELLLFGVTAFIIYNIYHDGKYLQLLKGYKKYYQMGSVAFLALSAYVFVKKYPSHSQSLFSHANSIIKYMPIDKDSTDFLTPFLDMTKNNSAMTMMGSGSGASTPEKRILSSGAAGNTKRCVSETKKKYVAASQNWMCGECKRQLPAWFEVDHRIRLDRGGTNQVDNLVAMCRDCHGKKTAFENF